MHITELRTALAAVFTAVAAPQPTYTTTPATGGVIQASNVNEIRAAVAFLASWSLCNIPATGLSPTSTSATGDGKTGTTVLGYTPGCSFTTSSNASWLTIVDASTLTVTYSVAPNDSLSPRNGTLTVDGFTFTVTQEAAAEVVTYVDTDAIGSVRMLTDRSGAVVGQFDYLPFGNIWTGAIGSQKVLFGGHEYDQNSGLAYFGARSFSMSVGRFTTPDDPANGGNPLNPQSWNLYTYARNNPLRFLDLFGADPCPVVDGVANCGEQPPITVTAPMPPPFFFSDLIPYFPVRPPGYDSSGAGSQPASQGNGSSQKACATPNGGSIVSGSVTKGMEVVGAVLGSALGPEGTGIGAVGGATLAGTIGRFVNFGLSISYVPSTRSLYWGPTGVVSPGDASGINVTIVDVGAGQDPNAVASGFGVSATEQRTRALGATIVKSPGNGPIAPGVSFGSRGSNVAASYNFCLVHCGC